MKNRRYTIGYDNRYLHGTEQRWPKARAVARAKEVVDSMGGAAVVSRIESDGVNHVVAWFYADLTHREGEAGALNQNQSAKDSNRAS